MKRLSSARKDLALLGLWRVVIGSGRRQPRDTPRPSMERPPPAARPLDLAPNDPLMAHFQSIAEAVDLDKIDLHGPALQTLKAAGIQLVVPLVSQGELIGLLGLGPRRSEQDYSADDRALLTALATQAAPALRIAQLVRERQAQAQERERLEQELRVARFIQQTLLPKELPMLPGWEVATHYQPAREVGGDFYDFLTLPDGRLGLIVGDVTDKGVPAALVMATTRSVLRGAIGQVVSPGRVLERANDLLCPDIPPNMFVTCLYAILDPQTGQLQYANAGHDLPYVRHADGVSELRATGMPLGLMPGMQYEEMSASLLPGELVLFYSDGLVEAHDAQRGMFSFPRLRSLVAEHPAGDGAALIRFLLAELERFTGAAWEQEDDITLVTLRRCAAPASSASPALAHGGSGERPDAATEERGWRTLAAWTVPSEPGNERLVMDRVAAVVEDFPLPAQRLERLKTAVSEATMNAIEHGNQNRPEVPVSITVLASPVALAVRIADQGGGRPIPEPATPNLDAKLAGLQTPRGWGLYLIKNLVDEMHIGGDETQHTIELILYLEGAGHGRETF
jgi:serine phosphatase RsbU (regulator of sigma subunit)/anti-sigma regulatory factor (Ser/Thr protein kinase)